ncbi:hypothetical protein [Acidithiobacillus sp.]|uniref:hypothetical protein n=1 Tax=Acidithiobacillus sp. TaxID=1872118 RepID=UPI00258BC1A7|nr:hypothetical protein [Acidithiobacillus sp.]MDD5374481.1 hypothetical protein [Acidithiobacillus sp.]
MTFVNGIAAEQQTEGESAQPADERAAAIKAVKEALQEEGKTAAKKAKEVHEQDPLRPRETTERDESGKFVAKAASDKEKEEPAKVAKEAEDDVESLKNVLKQRKQMAAAKAAQSQETQRAMQELRQYKAQLDQEKAEVERERQRFQVLRKDPAKAFREMGWDPEAAILDMAREGTPEGQAARQQREMQAELAEIRQWKAQQARQAEEYQAQRQQAQQVQYRQQVEKAFTSVALDESKHPHLAGQYAGQEALLLSQADVIAEQYRNLTGKEASLEDVAEYLEERSANWYKTHSSKQAPATSFKGKPAQGNATGQSLTPEGSSERRSLGTMLKDLDGEERLAAAREAVGAAFRHSGERS